MQYRESLTTELCKIEYLKHLCKRGWRKYITPKKFSREQLEIYKNRLNYELEILILKQFVSYFLMVQDYVVFAKQNGINVGPGRGSGAGSLVAYLLNITEIDPVQNKLMFERFLNPAVAKYDFQIDPTVQMYEEECKPLKLSKFPRWSELSTPQQETCLLEYRYIIKQNNLKYLVDLKREYRKSGLRNITNSFVSYVFQLTNELPTDNRITRLKVLVPGSIAVPDFDVDFADERRKEVIQYIFEKYGGVEYASAIGTHQTLRARNVIRDIARVFEMPLTEVSDIVKLIESTNKLSSSSELEVTLAEAIEKSPELRQLQREKPKIFDTALKLEGLPRNSGKHAAGLIVTPEPITNYIPLRKGDEEIPVSQLNMSEIAQLGLLKVDILGLRTLSIIGDCLKYIKDRTGQDIELRELGENYPKVWKLFNVDCFGGIFQVDGSQEMNRLCLGLKPSCKNDLAALVALHRPGPLSIGLHNKYIQRKHGEEKVEYIHPDVEDILEDTYGTMIYQEQLIQIAQKIAGYNAVQADELRKAISKSKPEMIENQRVIFMKGCERNGIPVQVALKLFEDFTKFGQYAFNRAHSASYGEIAFRTAWLKVHYPKEFYCALLNHTIDAKNMSAGTLISKYGKEMKKFFGLKLLPPDINKSDGKFSIDEEGIRFGLSQIKGLGEKCIPIIEGARSQLGKFTSFQDFTNKIKEFDSTKGMRSVNKKIQEALIYGGCFDELPYTESQPFLSRSLLIEYRDDIIKEKSIVYPENPWKESILDKQKMEKEVLGMSVSGEILSPYKDLIRYYGMCSIKSAKSAESMGKTMSIAAQIVDCEVKQDRRGEKMCFLTIEDKETIESLAIFSSVYAKVKNFCKKDLAVMIIATLDLKNRLFVKDIRPIESLVVT